MKLKIGKLYRWVYCFDMGGKNTCVDNEFDDPEISLAPKEILMYIGEGTIEGIERYKFLCPNGKVCFLTYLEKEFCIKERY